MLLRSLPFAVLSVVLVGLLAGCSRTETPQAESSTASGAASGDTAAAPPGQTEPAAGARRTFQPVVLGGGHGRTSGAPLTGDAKMTSIRDALDPLQILVGEWSGKTFRVIGGAVGLEEPHWQWDFTTKKDEPALVMHSETAPYLQTARLTWVPERKRFRLEATDRDGSRRVYEGNFSEPVQDVPGDGNSLQRTFKLELTQVEPADAKKLARIVLAQQENNRYLLEVYDVRGDNFVKYDTVGNQREGTSFAASLDDYGEKECIVSQGLGTISLSHDGKTYWVCCTGCKAAFEEDPERWVAKAEARKKAKK